MICLASNYGTNRFPLHDNPKNLKKNPKSLIDLASSQGTNTAALHDNLENWDIFTFHDEFLVSLGCSLFCQHQVLRPEDDLLQVYSTQINIAIGSLLQHYFYLLLLAALPMLQESDLVTECIPQFCLFFTQLQFEAKKFYI